MRKDSVGKKSKFSNFFINLSNITGTINSNEPQSSGLIRDTRLSCKVFIKKQGFLKEKETRFETNVSEKPINVYFFKCT